MLKSKVILVFLSGLFSILFLMAGTGYNIIHYCCGACESKGIEYIAHHSCGDVHHDMDVDCCDSDHKHLNHTHQLGDFVILMDADAETCDGSHCGVERLQLDDFSPSQDQSIAALDFSYHTLEFLETCLFFVSENVYDIPSFANPPPDFSLADGREILCKKTVLII